MLSWTLFVMLSRIWEKMFESEVVVEVVFRTLAPMRDVLSWVVC